MRRGLKSGIEEGKAIEEALRSMLGQTYHVLKYCYILEVQVSSICHQAMLYQATLVTNPCRKKGDSKMDVDSPGV